MECIVHVGMHKTGTTSIQHSLRGYEDERLVYATIGGSPNHSLPIYTLFSVRPEGHHLHARRGRSPEALGAYRERVRADLQACFAKLAGRSLLISGEDIRSLRRQELAQMREMLKPHFERVRIVAYVRPPAGFMTSTFQGHVTRGSLRRFDLSRFYPDYRRLQRFDDVFGRDNVEFWKYEPKSFPQQCAVRDFCQRLGIPLPAERIIRLNHSLSLEAIAALHTYARYGRKLGASKMGTGVGRRVGAVIEGQQKLRFDPALLRPVLEQFRGELKWIEARMGTSLSEDLEREGPGNVRSEEDLLRPNAEVVARIRGMLGPEDAAGVTGETPAEVARLVHALRKKVNRELKAARRERRETRESEADAA